MTSEYDTEFYEATCVELQEPSKMDRFLAMMERFHARSEARIARRRHEVAVDAEMRKIRKELKAQTANLIRTMAEQKVAAAEVTKSVNASEVHQPS